MFDQLLTDPTLLGFVAALGIGLLIGAERERRKGVGPARAPAGIRTFAIVALLGAVAARLGNDIVLAVLLAGLTGFVWNAYQRQRSTDPGITSEAALILTALLGVLAMQAAALAAGLGVIVAALLAARGWLHRVVREALTEAELHDLLILAAAILVVLPLVPDRGMGPFNALNPRQLWLIVVVIMSISAGGYVLQKIAGTRYGLPLAGLLSGFVSSTATIGAMGALARRTPALRSAAVAAAVLSTVATIIQMAVLLAVLSPPTFAQMQVPLLCAGVTAAAYGGVSLWRTLQTPSQERRTTTGRAVNLNSAALLAAIVAVVQILSTALEVWFGSAGVAVAATVAGFADTHAPAASTATLVAAGHLSAEQAVTPILLALSANTLTKLIVAFAAGGREYALPVACGLALVIAAAWLGRLLF